MIRVVVRSRTGNVVLAILGVLYTIGAIVVLLAFAEDVRDSAGLIDRAMQAGLVFAAACGLWFLLMALANLGLQLRRRLPHFSPRSSGT